MNHLIEGVHFNDDPNFFKAKRTRSHKALTQPTEHLKMR